MYWFDIADELLPPVYREIKDIYAYARSLDTELRGVLYTMGLICDDFFIQTCNEDTLSYWESLLQIPLMGNETLEERRNLILVYMNNSKPTSEPYVREVLAQLFGEENYTLAISTDNPFEVDIGIYDQRYDQIKQFILWFIRMSPAHILWHVHDYLRADGTNYITALSLTHETAYSSASMSMGSGTLYLGTDSYPADWMVL